MTYLTLSATSISDFADYGVCLEQFFVTTIVKPDGDRQYEKFKELHFRQYADIAEAKLKQQTDIIYTQTEAQKVVIDSQAQATKRAQEGYTYSQERGFDVAEKVAQNEAVGEFTNMGVGFGTMAGVSKFNGAFGAGYIFITIAFVGQLGCAYKAFKAENLKKMFYNIPLISVSYTGLIAMLVVGTVCMAVPFIPYWVGIIACLLVLAFFCYQRYKGNCCGRCCK